VKRDTHIQAILERSSVQVAPLLIGCKLYVKDQDENICGGTIVETEAYTQEDAASHTYKGRTPRTEVMFGPSGRIYVYFTYGMHWCMNIVTGHEGHGEAVLIRAIRPERGLEIIQERRKHKPLHELTNGPAKVCQALDVTGRDNGAVVNKSRFLLLSPDVSQEVFQIQATERIGITKDTHRLWRFIAV
jgi:DNA-3-methyladenine glycosylase